MATPAGQYLQFLAPQQQGPQVPDSQIQTQGPFSAQLSQPYYNPAPVPEPGRGGAGHALLSFANSFLEGASKGRLRAFQQSEQTKKEHERNYDAVVQNIQNDPGYTKDFKDQVMRQSLVDKAGASQAALGKGGKNDHPAVGLARSIFDHLVGPADNKKHVDIGPEHVSSLVGQMQDPANKFDMASVMGSTQQNLNQAIQDLQAAGQKAGVPVTQEDAKAHPKIIEALQPLMRQGYDPYVMPPIQAALSALPPRMTPAQQQALAMNRARQTMYEGKTMPNGVWSYKNPDGTDARALIDFRTDQQGNPKPYFTMTGQPVPADHPVMTGTPPSQNQTTWQTGTRIVTDADNNLVEIPNTIIRGKGTPPPPGTLPGAPGPATPAPPVPAAAPTGQTGVTPTPAGAPAAAAPTAPAGSIQALVIKAASTYGVEPSLALAIAKNESSFNPAAVSPRGAQGVMQLMPATAQEMGVKDSLDPQQNIDGGVRYFKQLLDKYNGDTTRALQAYNAGPGAVDAGKIPDETRTYTAQVLTDAGASRPSAPAAAAPPAATPAGAGTPAPPVGRIVGKKVGVASTPLNMVRTMTPEQSRALSTERASSPSLDKDAWDYMLTGKLNVRGMGKDVQPQVLKIKQTADQIANQLGIDSGEMLARGAELKGNIGAFAKVSQMAALIEGFEGTLLKNADVAKQLSDAFKRGDVQFLNRIAGAFKTGKGDQEALNLAGQIHTLGTEWAKVQAGSVSAQGVPATVQNRTDDLIAKGITDGQLNGLIDSVMIPDARNRTSANKEEMDRLLGRVRDVTKRNGAAGGQTANPMNPNPNGYIVGHVYGGLIYQGGDVNNEASWKKK